MSFPRVAIMKGVLLLITLAGMVCLVWGLVVVGQAFLAKGTERATHKQRAFKLLGLALALYAGAVGIAVVANSLAS